MALDWWINIGCWVSVPPLYRKDNAVYLPCRLPRYSLLVHCCKRAKHFKALDLETSGSQPGRPWGQLSQTSRGKNLSLSNFIENMSLCLKCSLFQFVNAKLKKKKTPGFLLCYPPTLRSKSFPWSWWDLFFRQKMVGERCLSRYCGGLGAQALQGHPAASSVPSVTLFMTWKYSLTTGERFRLKLLFYW